MGIPSEHRDDQTHEQSDDVVEKPTLEDPDAELHLSDPGIDHLSGETFHQSTRYN